MRSIRVAIVLVTSVFALASSNSLFQLRIDEIANDLGVDSSGNCCDGHKTTGGDGLPNGRCTRPCRTYFRVCLRQYESTISDFASCTFGQVVTPVLAENSRDFTKTPDFGLVTAAAAENVMQLPFNFSWPESFSLILEAWHENTLPGINEPRSQLILRSASQHTLSSGAEWTNGEYGNGLLVMRYRYRVVCGDNYYGPRCGVYCVPRHDEHGHYTCAQDGSKVCLDGYSGDFCHQAKCLPGCHAENGFCDRPNECRCKIGWQGKFCDQCVRYPGCLHGSCSKPWDCNCKPGWGGTFCNIDLNFCTHHPPCLNGGTCLNKATVDGSALYICKCPKGFTGAHCEIEIDDCQNSPCLNGATCIDKGIGYTCQCPTGYSGSRCEFNGPSSCANTPCRNGATCIDQDNGDYTCRCAPGFGGKHCHLRLNECASQPCQNGGSCIDQVNGYQCICKPGYHGQYCEMNFNDCSVNPCQNFGTCVDDENSFSCQCIPGFAGSLCEINIDDCLFSPCLNNGTCTDLINNFSCSCKQGWTGKTCSEPVNVCQSRPCKNGATCVQEDANEYLCLCPPGFGGEQCEKREQVEALVDRLLDKDSEEAEEIRALNPMKLLLIVVGCIGFALIAIIGVVIYLLCRGRGMFVKNIIDQRAVEENLNNARFVQSTAENYSRTVGHQSAAFAAEEKAKNLLLEQQQSQMKWQPVEKNSKRDNKLAALQYEHELPGKAVVTSGHFTPATASDLVSANFLRDHANRKSDQYRKECPESLRQKRPRPSSIYTISRPSSPQQSTQWPSTVQLPNTTTTAVTSSEQFDATLV